MRWIVESLSFGSCVAVLIFLGVLQYLIVDRRLEQFQREFDALKESISKWKTPSSAMKMRRGDAATSIQGFNECCLDPSLHVRSRRSADRTIQGPDNRATISSSPFSDLTKGEKGDKGARGPPGLPGMKGERGGCGCDQTTTEVMTTTPFPTIEPRQHDCQIKEIGIPLHEGEGDTYWGSWMRDSFTGSKFRNMYFLTNHFQGKLLRGVADLEHIGSNETEQLYTLSDPYFGTGHIIYNGSFIYHKSGFNELIKFDIEGMQAIAQVTLPNAHIDSENYLYYSNYTFFDLAADENGLWVAYSSGSESNTLIVSNLNSDDLSVRVTWRINVTSKDFGESFIVCGRLYFIKSTTTTVSFVDTVYDLYTNEWHNVHLQFNNPYGLNTMVSYNPVDKSIYSWDNGNLLLYPLKM